MNFVVLCEKCFVNSVSRIPVSEEDLNYQRKKSNIIRKTYLREE